MIFVDTVSWLYLFDKGQNNPEARKAKQFIENISRTESLFTSDLIIAETFKWLMQHGRPVNQSIEILELLLSQRLAIILSVETTDRNVALTLIKKYKDQNLSYEDALSVALALRLGIKKIFSFDKHFLLFPNLKRVP